MKFGQIILAAPEIDAAVFQQVTAVYPQLGLLALGHGHFADFAGVLEDIHHLLRHNAPPGKRQRPRPAGGHWRIKP